VSGRFHLIGPLEICGFAADCPHWKIEEWAKLSGQGSRLFYFNWQAMKAE
jgi:hypothetical protein